MQKDFKRFKDFYPFYLSEHRHRANRLMHFIGSWLVLIILFGAGFAGRYAYWILIPFVGYGFAWIGHFFFERNRPATFQYPLYSLIADWVMFKDILLGKVKL